MRNYPKKISIYRNSSSNSVSRSRRIPPILPNRTNPRKSILCNSLPLGIRLLRRKPQRGPEYTGKEGRHRKTLYIPIHSLQRRIRKHPRAENPTERHRGVSPGRRADTRGDSQIEKHRVSGPWNHHRGIQCTASNQIH